MMLYKKCDSCKKENAIKSHASTRPDLEMEKGEIFKLSCAHCGKIQKVHVNDIRARQNNMIVIGGIGLCVLFTALLWKPFGFIATFTFAVPLIIWVAQNKAVHAFNSYRIRRSA